MTNPFRTPAHREDHRLVRRLLRGDEDAFREFFGAVHPGLVRFATARLGDALAAEEVVQATLCRAVRKLGTYRGEAALFTWLCTFCRHEISAYRSRTGRAPEPVGLVDDLPFVRAALESLADDAPDRMVARREIAERVRRILDGLPLRYGRALRWKYLDELPVTVIAERLGVGEKAAESVLTRARAAFREAITVQGAETMALLDPRQGGAS